MDDPLQQLLGAAVDPAMTPHRTQDEVRRILVERMRAAARLPVDLARRELDQGLVKLRTVLAKALCIYLRLWEILSLMAMWTLWILRCLPKNGC